MIYMLLGALANLDTVRAEIPDRFITAITVFPVRLLTLR